jgi:hypothetical protein
MRVCLALFALTASSSAANDVWVDALHGDDVAGTGSASAPFQTLTQGVASLAGIAGAHTVRVAPGVYDGALGEQFPIVLMPQMTVLGSGAHQTALSGGGEGTLVRMGRSSTLSDLLLRRAEVAVESPGIAFATSAGMHYLRRCVVRESEIGVLARSDLHSDHGIALVNSTVVQNALGIAVENDDCDFQSVTVQLYGSVVSANAVAFDPLHGFTGCERYLGAFRSNLSGNGDDSLAGWVAWLPGLAGNVLGDPAWIGVDGNIGADAQLVAVAAGDVHVPIGSPAVDLPAPPALWPPQAAYNPPEAWIWESSFEQVVDADGDPRGLGAAIDAGADEVRIPALWATGKAKLGAQVKLRSGVLPGETLAVWLGFDVSPLSFLIAPPWLPLGSLTADAAGIGALLVGVPSDPGLTGLDVYCQAVGVSGTTLYITQAIWLRLLP